MDGWLSEFLDERAIMYTRKNNPRGFSTTVSLDAWRTPFDGEKGLADLHIDVVFAENEPFGGGDAPVRCRLSLRRAEVHVIKDAGGVLGIRSSTVRRSELTTSKQSSTIEQKTQVAVNGEAGASAGPTPSASGSVKAKGEASKTVTKKLECNKDLLPMSATHRKTPGGYAFIIEPQAASTLLKGQPWTASEPVLKIEDTKFPRKKGEPPDVRIEIQCRFEDLVIRDIEFTDPGILSWRNLHPNKQIAVREHIKEALARQGLPCGDPKDEFARIVLADMSPVVES